MSSIPEARSILLTVIAWHPLPDDTRNQLQKALSLMFREEYVRKAPAEPQHIDEKTREAIHALAATDLTMHEIANHVGLRNSGRVSEVLNGKR